MLYCTPYPSPLGELTLAAQKDALVGLWLPSQKYFGGGLGGWDWQWDDTLPVFARAKNWLDHYFMLDPLPTDTVPLAPIGSPFRQAVWRALRDIPYGETTTYGALAQKLAKGKGLPPLSAQAVGGAVAHNPISILIPCHRVVGARGSLTGYAGGIDKKLWLLTLEGVDTSRFHLPK